MASEKGVKAQTSQNAEKDALAAQKIEESLHYRSTATWWMMDARRLAAGRLASFFSLI
jgi:hypothetical protein